MTFVLLASPSDCELCGRRTALLRPLVSSSFVFAGGMSSTEATLRAELKAMLSVERAGRSLMEAMVETLVTHLVVNEKITRASDFSIEELADTASAAWPAVHDGAELPPLQKRRLTAWLANVPAGGSAETTPGSADVFSLTEDVAKLFGEAGPTTLELRRLAEDKAAQSLTGASILRLSLSLELGRVASIGEVIGVFY